MSGEVSFAPRSRNVPRIWGGLAATVYPLLLVFLGLSVGFRQGGGPTDLAASFIGALLFLTAAPTAWIFAFPFIEVSRFTVILVGTATGIPLWYMLGRALAVRSTTWWIWLRRFLTVAVVWTIVTFLVFALIALFEP